MNINKALVVTFGILLTLAVITVIRFNGAKSDSIDSVFLDNEALINHIHYIPEIIRSYEKVKDMIGKENALFFRYASNSCSSCIHYYIMELLAFQEDVGKAHVWIFPAFPDDRGTRIQLRNELEKYNYLNISADSLLIPTNGGEPKNYFAYMNAAGDIGMVFIPDINNPQFFRNYFQEVKQAINNQKELK